MIVIFLYPFSRLSVLCECKVTPEEIRGETDCALCFRDHPVQSFGDSMSSEMAFEQYCTPKWGHMDRIAFKNTKVMNVMQFLFVWAGEMGFCLNVLNMKAMMVFCRIIKHNGIHFRCVPPQLLQHMASCARDAGSFQSEMSPLRYRKYTWAKVRVPLA